MKVAIIVAHPDDETIWSGGLVLRHPEWRWTVMSLCRADDPDRAPKFKKVCAFLGSECILSDVDDAPRLKPLDPRKEIGDRIVAALGGEAWDLCVTHGRNGEYGHRRHEEVYGEVVRLVSEGRLRCEDLWTFAYECDTGTGSCRPASWAERLVELTADQLSEKRRIIHEMYGYEKDSFEVKASISPEAYHHVQPR